ncbi:polysaccharide pyruvyl transferase family protein, partial [Streptomyces coelicoflavus]
MTHSSLASASASDVSSSAVSSSAGSPSVADDRSTVTGRRRIAFAAHTGRDGLPGLAALLRSLALTNPGVCEDFVVLHPGLPDSSFDGLRRLHPRVVTRLADDRRAVFGLEGYDTVMALGPGMVVLGDLGELLRMRHGIGAGGPPQQAGGGRGVPPGGRPGV